MKTQINHQLISQTVIDSGELAMLGAVIHNFGEPGEYHVAVLSGKLVVATHTLRVAEQSPAMQVNIDLAPPASGTSDRTSSGCDCNGEDSSRPGQACFTVNPAGHALFYVSRGTDGYAVQVNKVDDPKILFDSRQLQEGDLFAATLLRPGSYLITNTPAGYEGEVIVAYPTPGKAPFKAPSPVSIEATKSGLMVVADGKEKKLDKIGIEATQGQLFKIKTPSRIRIELVKPDDGPDEKHPVPVLSWNKQVGPTAVVKSARESQTNGVTKQDSNIIPLSLKSSGKK